MGKGKNFLMFGLAGMFALGAVWLANNWIAEKAAGPEVVSDDMRPVVVASIDVEFGRLIQPSQLKVIQMSKTTAPSGTFDSVDDVKGKVALQAIYAGDILREQKVRDHMGGSTLAAVIAPGMRAVTVRVNDVIGVAGFLLPGNRVDVIATSKGRDKTSANTLLKNIKVLAVDQTASPDKDMPVIVRAVTLELTPQDSERLVKATTEGAVQLALRNPVEEAVAEEDVKALEAPKIVTNVPPAKSFSDENSWITLIRGTKVEKADVIP